MHKQLPGSGSSSARVKIVVQLARDGTADAWCLLEVFKRSPLYGSSSAEVHEERALPVGTYAWHFIEC
jgi:hypothetical protein